MNQNKYHKYEIRIWDRGQDLGQYTFVKFEAPNDVDAAINTFIYMNKVLLKKWDYYVNETKEDLKKEEVDDEEVLNYVLERNVTIDNIQRHLVNYGNIYDPIKFVCLKNLNKIVMDDELRQYGNFLKQKDFEKAGLKKIKNEEWCNTEDAYQLTFANGDSVKVVHKRNKENGIDYLTFDFSKSFIMNPVYDIYRNYNEEWGRPRWDLEFAIREYNETYSPTQKDMVNLIEKVKKAYDELSNCKMNPITVYKLNDTNYGYYTLERLSWKKYFEDYPGKHTLIWKKDGRLYHIGATDVKQLEDAGLAKVVVPGIDVPEIGEWEGDDNYWGYGC